MNRKVMPLILMLVAGAVTCVITFVKNYSMLRRMVMLLIVLLVFYFLGSVMKLVLDIFDKQNEERSKEEGEVIEKDMEVESEEQQESAREQ